jgi:hypothetical protein
LKQCLITDNLQAHASDGDGALVQQSGEILDIVKSSLTRKKFAVLLSKLKADMSERNIQALFDKIDTRKDGEIDLREVHAYVSQYSPMTRKQVTSKALRACMDFAGVCNIFTVIWVLIFFGNALWEDVRRLLPGDKINNVYIIGDFFSEAARPQRARCAGVGRTGIGYNRIEEAATRCSASAALPSRDDGDSEPQAERND